MLPQEPEERQAGDVADAADVARQAELAEDRQVEPAVVGGVARGPQHARDAGRREVQLGHLGRLEVERLAVVGRQVEAGPLRERVPERAEPLVEELVGEPQVRGQVRGEAGPLPVGALEPPDEPDPAGREPAQVRVVPAAVPRQVRVAREPQPRIGQRVDGRQRRAELRPAVDEPAQPPEEVATAIASRGPPAVPDRERHLAPGLLQFLGELDAGLARADEQHAAGWQRIGVSIVVGVDLVDPRRERRSGRRDPRRVERALSPR